MYVLIYTFRFSEPYRPDPIRSDHSRLCQFPTRFGPDPHRSHPLWPNPIRLEPTTADPARPRPDPNPIRTCPNRPAQPDPNRLAPITADPISTRSGPEPISFVPIRADPIRTDPIRTDPIRPRSLSHCACFRLILICGVSITVLASG